MCYLRTYILKLFSIRFTLYSLFLNYNLSTTGTMGHNFRNMVIFYENLIICRSIIIFEITTNI